MKDDIVIFIYLRPKTCVFVGEEEEQASPFSPFFREGGERERKIITPGSGSVASHLTSPPRDNLRKPPRRLLGRSFAWVGVYT